ncbi:chemotaxis protein CheB [Robbsia sp. KACC 23696]|uniref:chemotaxis protein CheB n=1 Tax=Robbsia sp. KACC 23696 TaxID=3149231 RepID=UPI00325A7E40
MKDSSPYHGAADPERDRDDDALFDKIDAIVIGASAGGVEALNRLLPALPASLPVPVLVVLHLLPDVQSELAELFGARCVLRVVEANDRQPLQPGTVHIAPPGYHLLVGADLTCSLSIDEPVNFSRPSIDVLFESAAWTYQSRVLGILLTGASADGAVGLVQIRSRGGLAWVQTPETALADTMPLAAIALGATDRVLSIEDIARALRHAADVASDAVADKARRSALTASHALATPSEPSKEDGQ